MNTENIKHLINLTKGKFFSIVYVDKKGQESKFVVRTGVRKHLKGGTNHCPTDAVTLYAVTKNGKHDEAGYKTLYVDKIKCISVPAEAVLNS